MTAMNEMAIAVKETSGVIERWNPDGSGSVEARVSWQISPDMARRKVTRFVGDEIGNLLFGGQPLLVVGESIRWRVPIQLAYRNLGTVGEAHYLDVNAVTGEILYTPDDLEIIRTHADLLAKRYASQSI